MNLNEIAKKLHVSRWTVSRAMNSNGYVEKKKKKLILKYLAKVKYVPNFHASSLAGKKPKIIGLVLPKDVITGLDFFLAGTIKYLTLALESRGYYLMLFVDEKSDNMNIVRLWENKTIAGAVIFSPTKDDDRKLNNLVKYKVPSVIIFSRYKGIDSFLCDNEKGGYIATKYLIEKGRKRIAFIHGYPRWVDSAGRFDGYIKALEEYGIKYDKALIKNGFFSLSDGKKAVQNLLNQPGKPDAIFAANDNMAMGAVWAINENKMNIPEDIAVIGFDNNTETNNTNPPLTTMSQPIKEIIENSAERLIARIGGEKLRKPAIELCAPALIIRSSV